MRVYIIYRPKKTSRVEKMIYHKTPYWCDLCYERVAAKVDKYGRKLCNECHDDMLTERDELIGDDR